MGLLAVIVISKFFEFSIDLLHSAYGSFIFG